MKNKIIKILIFILLISPVTTQAEEDITRVATENAVKDARIFLTLETFDASSSAGIFNIWINPEFQSINASGVVLNYATSSIAMLAIMTGNSFCDFFLNNTFDNSLGKLSLSGMKPYPGVATTSLMGQVYFQKLSEATSTLSIIQEESMILTNNGYATDILATSTGMQL